MKFTLCGFASSNYYNKAKLALMVTGASFEELVVYPGDVNPEHSPLRKVPYLLTAQGAICESQVIVDYLAESFPNAGLYPSDPYEAAKVRELCTFLDEHIEIVARRLHPEALWRGKVSDGLKQATLKDLTKNIKAFKKLAKFSPYIAGDTLTAADFAAYCHLPLVKLVGKRIWDIDLFESIDLKAYLDMLNQNPVFAKVSADAKADGPAFAQYIKAVQEKMAQVSSSVNTGTSS